MKWKFGILSLFVMCAFMAAPASSSSATPEFRGLWVHNWIPGLLSPEETDATFKWAKDANFNAILVQVRRVGDAYYDSAYEPRAANLKGGPDYDLLAYSIEKARETGLEIHAWVNIFRVWTTETKPPDPKHVANLHPEWMSKTNEGATTSGDGQFLDPGVPEVQDFIVKLVMDIVKKYDIDGLHLDYIRYPGRNWGYNDIAVKRFNEEFNRTGTPEPTDPQWSQWRRDQVTATVRKIYEAIDKEKPWVKVTASTIPWGGCPDDFTRTDAYSAVFQDWRLWMREGLIDANMPMNYKDPANERHRQWYLEWIDGMKRWAFNRHVYCGIMVFRGNAAGAASQVEIARQKGIGAVGFAFNQGAHAEELGRLLRTRVYANPAPLPPMPWKAERPAAEEDKEQ